MHLCFMWLCDHFYQVDILFIITSHKSWHINQKVMAYQSDDSMQSMLFFFQIKASDPMVNT